MIPLVVCDSGLGGLDVAAHFFSPNAGEKKWDIIYVNAYPSREWGYNDLPTLRAQEDLFQSVLEDMRQYSPAQCLIACNTLSIIWQRLSTRYKPPFPVTGIIDAAVNQMSEYMLSNPQSELLLLGTKSTIESGIYPKLLEQRGISPERLHSMACPRLATLIEQGPKDSAVSTRISEYAIKAQAMFHCAPKRLALAFCCTHYGYATAYWRAAFQPLFGDINVLNPNDAMTLPGAGASFKYVTKTAMTESQQSAMAKWFDNSAYEIAEQLRLAPVIK